MLRVVEISECFPNTFKPQTGEFILHHARAMSEQCKLMIIVPLRNVPPREAMNKGIAGIKEWYRDTIETEGFTEGNLTVEYMNYISLPRPTFESVDEKLITLLFRNKLRQLISSFEPGVILNHWLRPWAGITAGIAGELGIPFIIDHHEDLPTMKKLFPDSYKKFLEPMTKADSVIVHSSQNLEDLTSELPSLSSVQLIHLGQNFPVDTNKRSFDHEQMTLLCVSHLEEPRKNIDVLIEAVSELPRETEFKLRIAGDGSLRSGYESLAKKLDVSEQISFEGTKSQSEVMALLDKADMFVLPSFPEAFGIVFAEALARGVPVVTCNGNGGGEELKRLGYPVMLCEPGDPTDLARKISQLANNKILMKEMSDAGKRIASNHFSWKINAENTIELMESAIKHHKG